MTWSWSPEALAAMSKRMTSPFWRENDAKLRALVAAGTTYAAIGVALGITKNAAIGKPRRIGIGGERRPEPTPRPAQTVFPNPGRCLWPHGHPGEDGFHFCGERAETGRPYCGEHHARAHRPIVYRSADEAAAERAVAWAVTRSAS